MEGIVTDLPMKSAVCCWFTDFVQPLWSRESIHRFAAQQAAVVVSQPSQVTAPGCSSLLSWPKARATPCHRDAGTGEPSAIQDVWSEFAPLIHFSARPTAGLYLLNHSPCFTFTFLLHVYLLLKLLPGYWAKIISCDLIAQHQTCDRQNRWRRADLFLWQTSSWCLINSIIRANRSVVPTSTHFLSDTTACDGGWLAVPWPLAIIHHSAKGWGAINWVNWVHNCCQSRHLRSAAAI